MGSVFGFRVVLTEVDLVHGGLVVMAVFGFVAGGHRRWARKAAFRFVEGWERWASCEKRICFGVDFVVVCASSVTVMSWWCFVESGR